MPNIDEILQSGTMTGRIVRASYMEYEAGDNIQINGNIISATDTVYYPGEGISFTGTTINSDPDIASNSDIDTLFQ